MAARDDEFVNRTEEISKKLNIPKEFISKNLQRLTESGIIESKKGKSGGYKLAKHPSKIKLIDIVEAIYGLDTIQNCVIVFQNCMVKKNARFMQNGLKLLMNLVVY